MMNDITNSTKVADEPLLSSTEAEDYLQAALGEPDGYWRIFLQNNRRPERKPTYAIPFEIVRRRPHYQRRDLDVYIELHRAAELQRGKVPGSTSQVLQSLGGWPTGRPFVGWVSTQVEEATGIKYVRLHLADPLAVYRLEPEEARAVPAEMQTAADLADGIKPGAADSGRSGD